MPQSQCAVVVDTSHSRHAWPMPVPSSVVTLTAAFGAPRRRTSREVMLPAEHEYLEETDRIAAIRAAVVEKAGSFDRIRAQAGRSAADCTSVE